MKHRCSLVCLPTVLLLAASALVACSAPSEPPVDSLTDTNEAGTTLIQETEREESTEAESDPTTETDTYGETETETDRETETTSAAEDDTVPSTEAVTDLASETVLETETTPETVPETVPEIIAAFVSTDKTVYEVDEDILMTAGGHPDDTVAFFPAHFDPAEGTPIYYAAFSGENAITAGEAVRLTDLPGQNRKVHEVAFYYGVLPVGQYRLVIQSPTGEVRAETTLAIQFSSETIRTGAELAAKCLDVALNYKTLYVNGCFGAPMTDANKARYTQNTAYNRQPERQAIINAASADTFGFDCVCLIKGLLWGWDGNLNHVYGGASYQAGGIPDITEESMIERSNQVSTDFRNIEVGEVVWIQGHIGVYIGNGLCVECTPAWENCVQITACNTRRPGYNARTWTKHGKLPYLEYTGEYESVK